MCVGGARGQGSGVVLYAVKMYLACLMLKKKLMPLIIELVVILNHLGVIHFLGEVQFCDPRHPLHL